MIRSDQGVVFSRGRSEPLHPPELAHIITADAGLTEILALLPRYALTNLPILLMGEPGTGKELVAFALQALSQRVNRPFQRLNCSALTESLACSELFGHVRGAFTDAHAYRPGKFRLAHTGTLFLDEVGDLPLAVQPRLLRALEQGEVEPVGGDETVEVDVRLIAATNQDLPNLMNQGLFRPDLYHRLAVLVLNLPPLRARPQDIPLLAEHFVQDAARRYCPNGRLRLSTKARRRLEEYSWPGNVRELKNVIIRAALASSGGLIRAADITFLGEVRQAATPWPRGLPGPRPCADELLAWLGQEGGNVSALARRLRVCTKTVYRWLRADGVNPKQWRQPAAPGATAPAKMLLCQVGAAA